MHFRVKRAKKVGHSAGRNVIWQSKSGRAITLWRHEYSKKAGHSIHTKTHKREWGWSGWQRWSPFNSGGTTVPIFLLERTPAKSLGSRGYCSHNLSSQNFFLSPPQSAPHCPQSSVLWELLYARRSYYIFYIILHKCQVGCHSHFSFGSPFKPPLLWEHRLT